MLDDRNTNGDGTPPVWLRWFINDVTRGLIDRDIQGPLGCHFFHDDESGTWEVTLFASCTEVVGGPRDGSILPHGMQFDVSAAILAFDAPPRIHWQVGRVADDDELGSHLSFEGVARGRSVWLRLKEDAPEWAGPGRLLHSADGTLEELW
jgi:hypothetical protein